MQHGDDVVIRQASEGALSLAQFGDFAGLRDNLINAARRRHPDTPNAVFCDMADAHIAEPVGSNRVAHKTIVLAVVARQAARGGANLEPALAVGVQCRDRGVR